MLNDNKELWISVLAAVLIAGMYAFVMYFTGKVPAAGELFGHALGILGFVLMLMTEILYSLRKRSRSARWGKMSTWLRFHIFTGLVGPFMVFWLSGSCRGTRQIWWYRDCAEGVK